MADDDDDEPREYESLDELVDDIRDRKVLALAFRDCPECGKPIACKWTPDGTKPPAGCHEHN